MTLEPSFLFGALSALVAAVAWLIRLEDRVHKNAGTIETNRLAQSERLDGIRDTLTDKLTALDRALGAHEAKADAEARAGRETRETLIRMEEQIKHLIDLVERQAPARRKTTP